MRKVLSLAVCAICLLCSCSDDKEDNKGLVGLWDITSMYWEHQKLIDNVWSTYEEVVQPFDFKVTMEFKRGGTGELLEYSEKDGPCGLPLKWTQSGQNLTIELGDEEDVDILPFTILSFDKNTMTLFMEEYAIDEQYRSLTTLGLKRI